MDIMNIMDEVVWLDVLMCWPGPAGARDRYFRVSFR
jgi:hypothetical protein